ncbi:MAG TPA: hypothetical protein ENO10_06485 [Salinimicrobium catena]|uniref:Cardiolipin synthase N-terminal domain-containing protein n=1 Tax=Salinimicrobium catena TaxID=390640 RepID=A0A7C2R9D2_9FLAO|nr:hypothetical protein [Salinimicrobium catena]
MTGFLVKYRVAVIILFYLFQFTWLDTKSSLLALEEMGLLAWLSLTFLLCFWFTLLFDMIRTPINNKTFWLFSMLIFPWLAPAVYLFQRKKLNPLQTSAFSKKRN